MFCQVYIVSALNFRSLRQRFWQSMVIVVGLGATIGVLLSMMSMTAGMKQAYFNAGDPRRAIAPIIETAPGVRKDVDGRPIADRGIQVGVALKKRTGIDAYIFMRGFGPKGFVLRPDFKIVAGRFFQAGKRELIAGVGAQGQYAGLDIGDKVILPDGPWTVVGVFTGGHDIIEGQLIGDTDTLMIAARHKDYNTVIVRLASLDSLATFKKALTSNPALAVDVERQTDWYHKLNNEFYTVVSGLAYGVGALLAVGALFCAINTMYAAVAARGKEIATLRALGYEALPVAVSVLAEAVFLSVAGALIGAGLAWALYDGQQDSFGINVFYLTVSPAMVGLGIVWAIARWRYWGVSRHPSIHPCCAAPRGRGFAGNIDLTYSAQRIRKCIGNNQALYWIKSHQLP